MLAMILNETIFHPQGGGQPGDHGIILNSITKEEVFIVVDTRVSPTDRNVIYHYGHFAPNSLHDFLDTDRTVLLHVNEQSRRLNARLHSAGHLLDKVC